jgi:hypothetical protein
MSERTNLIDEWIDSPEGVLPEKIHIFFDKSTRDYADQYTSALHVARNIPFNISTIPVTDPLSLVVANVFNIKEGNVATQKARAYYERWAYDALKHGWVLALLENNEFTNTPEPYDESKLPRGIPVLPEPKYDLSNPTEYRLKQIFDWLASDINLQMTVMTTINNAFAKLVSETEAEETDKRTGFQPEPANSDVHAEIITDNSSVGKRSSNRSKAKV